MVSRYVDNLIYRSWLTKWLRDAQYSQSANRYIESSSQASEGSGALMKVIVSLLSISNNF